MVGPNPFRGLSSYGSGDREVLFGRDDDLTLVLARIFAGRATLLFAGTGVGKTSFLNAKVIPELERRYCICAQSVWRGDEPLAALQQTLRAAWSLQGFETPPSRARLGVYRGDTDAGRLQLQQTEHETPPRYGASLIEMLPALHERLSGTLFVLDQFEEVFQNHRDTPEFDRFVVALSALINSASPEARIVMSMREEFLGELSAFDNKVPDLFGNYYRLKAPARRQTREIIVATARSAGVGKSPFLDGLVDDLMRTATPGLRGPEYRSREFASPSYLQIACQRLWQRNPPTETTGFPSSYKAGDANDSIRAYCDEHLDPLPSEIKELIASASGFLITRQGAKMAYELTSLAEHLKVDPQKLDRALSILSEPRILRRTPAAGDAVWYELYHDMYAPFLTAWAERYRSERDTAIQESRTRAELERTQAQQLAKLAEERVMVSETRASALDSKRRRSGYLLVFATLLGLVAAALAVNLNSSKSKLARAAEAGPILDRATLLADSDPELAGLLALAAAQLSGAEADHSHIASVLGDVLTAPLYTQVAKLGPLRAAAVNGDAVLAATKDDTEIVRLSTDLGSEKMEAAGKDDTQIFRLSTDRKPEKIRDLSHADSVRAYQQGFVVTTEENAAFTVDPNGQVTAVPRSSVPGLKDLSDTANGKRATVSGYDLAVIRNAAPGKNSTVKIGPGFAIGLRWNADASKLLVGFDDGHAVVMDGDSLAIAAKLPKGEPLAAVGWNGAGAPVTVSEAGNIRVWDLNTPLKRIRASGQRIIGVSLSPDGSHLAAGSADGHVRFIDFASGGVKDWINVPPTKAVWDVAVSPDGQAVACVTLDGVLDLWTTHGKNFDGRTFSKSIWAVDYAPDGKSLAIALSDGHVEQVKLPIDAKAPSNVISTHKGRAVAVRFAPDGKSLASAGWDRRLLVAPIGKEGRQQDFTPAGSGGLIDLCYGGANRDSIAAADWSGVAHIMAGKTEKFTLRGHSGPVLGVACRPGTEEYASSGQDGTVRLWKDGAEVLRYSAHTGAANRVEYSKDGKWLVSSGDDGYIRTWAASYDDLLALARHAIKRRLTSAECQNYLHTPVCP